jgi:hypothetical protein
LSAVITLAVTALLGVLLDSSRWTGLATQKARLAGLSYNGQAAIRVAFVLLLAALTLYLLTKYFYNCLLIPPASGQNAPSKRWCSPESTGRESGTACPGTPAAAELISMGRFRNMQRTWFWLFTPANILVGLALIVLAAALLALDGCVWAVVAVFDYLSASGLVVSTQSWQ